MENLPLPDYDEVPLEQVSEGVAGLRLIFVNVYAITSNHGGWVLLDSGLPHSTGRIRKWADKLFGAGAPPLCILQTHGHFDHVGALTDLAREWDVPVYAHAEEFPYLNGQSQYPPPDTAVGGGVMPLISPLFPRGPVDIGERLRPLNADGSIDQLPGWRWIHTPGHTKGHISLFRDQDRLLLVGDAFCTTNQQSFFAAVTQKPELNGPPAYYTPDWDSARASVRKLAELRPATIAPGHGLPMRGPEVETALATLAREFDRYALPDHLQAQEKTSTAR